MKTVVILHGWGQSSKDWEVMKNMLENDFRVVHFDLPGFGIEPIVSHTWSIPEYSKWVEERVKKEINSEKVTLLGHSFGGRISSHLASQDPHWLESLILYSSPSVYRPTIKTKLKILLAKLKNKIGLSWLKFHQNKELEEADKTNLGKIYRNVVPFDQTEGLKKIKIKTLIITGEKDSAVPFKISKEIRRLIENSEFKVIERVGHNAHKENPYLFYGLVKQFIQNI